MRLKSGPVSDERCAASRCDDASEVITDVNGERRGWCPRHWLERCAEDEERMRAAYADDPVALDCIRSRGERT